MLSDTATLPTPTSNGVPCMLQAETLSEALCMQLAHEDPPRASRLSQMTAAT